MRFKASPVTSLEDATIDFEQLEPFLTNGDITSDSTGTLARVAKLNGTALPLKGSAWTAPTLINSWVNLAGFETAGYLKDPVGFVHLKGVMQNGTNNTAAFVLPAGFRPGAKGAYAGGAGSLAFVEVDASGNVILSGTPAGGIGVSGLSFLAEN